MGKAAPNSTRGFELHTALPADSRYHKSYSDGKVPKTSDPYAEIERLRLALIGLMRWQSKNVKVRHNSAYARAAEALTMKEKP